MKMAPIYVTPTLISTLSGFVKILMFSPMPEFKILELAAALDELDAYLGQRLRRRMTEEQQMFVQALQAQQLHFKVALEHTQSTAEPRNQVYMSATQVLQFFKGWDHHTLWAFIAKARGV